MAVFGVLEKRRENRIHGEFDAIGMP